MTFWIILTALCLFLGLMLMLAYIIDLAHSEAMESEEVDRVIKECEAKIKARMRQ